MGRLAGVLVGLSWVIACSGGEQVASEQLQVGEVESGWDATHSVLTLVTADSGSDVAIPSKPEPFEHTCADGGAAWVDGALEVSTGIGRMDATVSFWVHFDQCKKGGVEISGMVRYDRAYSLRGSALEVSLGWDGDLVWQGAVEGACEVDLSGVAESDHAVIGRHLVEMEQGMMLNGTICGLDAQEDLNWSLER